MRRQLFKTALALIVLGSALLSGTRSVRAARPVYAVRGAEAVMILPLLDDAASIKRIQPGGLQAVLAQGAVAALVMPADQADKDDPDWATAHNAAIQIRLMQRHTTVDSILSNIQTLGELTGNAASAARLLYRIADGLARVKDLVREQPPVRVLVLSPEGYTQGQGAFITELITLAGGINVSAEAGIPEARQIEDSRIRDLAPGVILLVGWTETQTAAFVSVFPYRDVAAIVNGAVYRIDAPGKDPARLVLDVLHLARLLHPS